MMLAYTSVLLLHSQVISAQFTVTFYEKFNAQNS